MKVISIVAFAAVLLAGCATPTVVDTKKVGDAKELSRNNFPLFC
jgi:hypothetical protein